MKSLLLILSVSSINFVVQLNAAFGQKITRQQYIEAYSPIAIKHMGEYGIPASITLAQGILESGDGNSDLATKANNHFGIKCHSDWTGKRFFKDDDQKNECFRVYKHAEESYHDHAVFLAERSRYKFLFDFEATDYKSWAKGLKEAGYATNPKYPELLIKIIEDNQLYVFDQKTKDAITVNKANEMVAQNTANAGSVATFGKSDNDVKYFIAKGGETASSIAAVLDMRAWQITSYNDVTADYKFEAGEKIYLAGKRSRAKEKTHVSKGNETLWQISQQYAIKLKKLVKLNPNLSDRPTKAGEEVKLK